MSNVLLDYQAHLNLPFWSAELQESLAAVRILCVGAGGLAAAALPYLATSGIATIGVMDADRVASSNLQRQTLFSGRDVGNNKATCVRSHLQSKNPALNVVAYETMLTPSNAQAIISNYDLVLDCADNHATSLIINKICTQLNKAWVYASLLGTKGQLAIFCAQTPCYVCVFGSLPAATVSCAQAGVLSTAVGFLGILQANEVLKYLAQCSSLGDFHVFDALHLQHKSYQMNQDTSCIVCSDRASSLACQQPTTHPSEAQEPTDSLMHGAPLRPKMHAEITRLLKTPCVQLIDVREPFEFASFNVGGVSIPMRELHAHIPRLDKKAPMLVVCAHGIRSAQALALLQTAGFVKAMHLDGGLSRWWQWLAEQLPNGRLSC